MNLRQLLDDHGESAKLSNAKFDEKVFGTVVSTCDGSYWVKLSNGVMLSVTPEEAASGWALYLQKKTSKKHAWFFEPGDSVTFRDDKWMPDSDLVRWHRVENLDFEFVTYE